MQNTGRSRIRRVTAGSCLLALIATATSGCSSSSASRSSNAGGGGLTTINVSNTSISGDEVPFAYANATNLWAKYGLKVNVVNVTTSAQMASLGAGQADIALGSPASIEAAQKGAAEKVIANLGEVPLRYYVQSNITSFADLKGKSVGASAPGSLLDAAQQLYLQKQGLNKGDYKTVYTAGSFAAVITALLAGSISASFASHPFIDKIEAAKRGLHSLVDLDSTEFGVFSANTATVNTNFAAKHKDTVIAFLKAWNAAAAAVKTDQTDAAKYLASAAKVDITTATAWVKDAAPLGGAKAYTKDEFANLVKGLAFGEPTVVSATYEKSIDNTFITAATTS